MKKRENNNKNNPVAYKKIKNNNLNDELERLMLAISEEKDHEACELIKGMNVSQLNKRKRDEVNTPLIAACKNGLKEVVESLIKKGVELDAVDHQKYTPLCWACYNKFEDIAKILIDKGVTIKNKNYNYNNDPLMIACRNGLKSVVELLIEKGALINPKSKKYKDATPLSEACKENHEEIVEILIKKGADMEAKTSNGHNSIMWNCGGFYNERGIWGITEKDNIARLIVKNMKLLTKGSINIEYYNKIKFQVEFEQKCEKDVEWLKSGKLGSWELLKKMTKYYVKGYKEKFSKQIEPDNDKFFDKNAIHVIKALKIHIKNNWFKNVSKNFKVNSYDYETNKEATKLSEVILIHKNPLTVIGEHLFKDLYHEIDPSGNSSIFDN